MKIVNCPGVTSTKAGGSPDSDLGVYQYVLSMSNI
ncbi:MAG: hypothetical protein QG575_1111 [Euryarchaeota archaeon]|nr:hypothetical protein [Euryarchaeota archaeon]